MGIGQYKVVLRCLSPVQHLPLQPSLQLSHACTNCRSSKYRQLLLCSGWRSVAGKRLLTPGLEGLIAHAACFLTANRSCYIQFKLYYHMPQVPWSPNYQPIWSFKTINLKKKKKKDLTKIYFIWLRTSQCTQWGRKFSFSSASSNVESIWLCTVTDDT